MGHDQFRCALMRSGKAVLERSYSQRQPRTVAVILLTLMLRRLIARVAADGRTSRESSHGGCLGTSTSSGRPRSDRMVRSRRLGRRVLDEGDTCEKPTHMRRRRAVRRLGCSGCYQCVPVFQNQKDCVSLTLGGVRKFHIKEGCDGGIGRCSVPCSLSHGVLDDIETCMSRFCAGPPRYWGAIATQQIGQGLTAILQISGRVSPCGSGPTGRCSFRVIRHRNGCCVPPVSVGHVVFLPPPIFDVQHGWIEAVVLRLAQCRRRYCLTQLRILSFFCVLCRKDDMHKLVTRSWV